MPRSGTLRQLVRVSHVSRARASESCVAANLSSMGFSWRGGDVGGLSRLGSGLEPREPRSAAARAVRAWFAELDRLEVGALYRSDIHSVSIAEKTAPFSSECFFENTFLLASSVSQKRCFLANLNSKGA